MYHAQHILFGTGQYTLGIPLLYYWLTWRSRAVLLTKVEDRTEAQIASVQSIAFLWDSYAPHGYYFESVAALFRLMLCGGINAWWSEGCCGVHIVPCRSAV